MKPLKVTISPPALSKPAEFQYGLLNYASFGRIIEGMKASGEMSKNAEVIGIQIESNGLSFVLKS